MDIGGSHRQTFPFESSSLLGISAIAAQGQTQGSQSNSPPRESRSSLLSNCSQPCTARFRSHQKSHAERPLGPNRIPASLKADSTPSALVNLA